MPKKSELPTKICKTCGKPFTAKTRGLSNMDPEEKKIANLKKKVSLPKEKKRVASSPEEQKINKVRNLDETPRRRR